MNSLRTPNGYASLVQGDGGDGLVQLTDARGRSAIDSVHTVPCPHPNGAVIGNCNVVRRAVHRGSGRFKQLTRSDDPNTGGCCCPNTRIGIDGHRTNVVFFSRLALHERIPIFLCEGGIGRGSCRFGVVDRNCEMQENSKQDYVLLPHQFTPAFMPKSETGIRLIAFRAARPAFPVVPEISTLYRGRTNSRIISFDGTAC